MTGIKAPDSMSHDSHGHEPYVPVFTGDAGDELRMLLTRYPTKMAALLPALWTTDVYPVCVQFARLDLIAAELTLMRQVERLRVWPWAPQSGSSLQ